MLVVAGATFALLAAVGLIRFKDVLTRMHAATKPATLGLILILSGTMLVMPTTKPLAKLALVILLQFITAPVGAHLLGRAAFRTGTPLQMGTTLDEAAERLRGTRPPE